MEWSTSFLFAIKIQVAPLQYRLIFLLEFQSHLIETHDIDQQTDCLGNEYIKSVEIHIDAKYKKSDITDVTFSQKHQTLD